MSSVDKTDAPGMVKDRATGLVSNTDRGHFEAIKKQRAAAKAQRALQSKIDDLERRVSALEARGLGGILVR